MAVIHVLALLERSLAQKTHAIKHAIMKVTHIMKEIHSLVLMDVIRVLALLEMSLAQNIHVIKLLASTKAKLIMKEIHFPVLMAINLVLVLQDKSNVLI